MASPDASWDGVDFASLDLTSQLLVLVQADNTIGYPSLKKAVAEAKDEDDRRILKSWANIQTILGAMLVRERDGGLLTDDQCDFILAWLSEWVEYGPDEAGEQLKAWLQWTGRWRECST